MKFTINDKVYEGAKYDMNTHCLFEEYKTDVLLIQKQPLSVLRAYLSISSGMDLDEAGKEIEAHIIKGGKLEDISKALLTEMDQSDFFLAMVGGKKKPAKATKKNEDDTEV